MGTLAIVLVSILGGLVSIAIAMLFLYYIVVPVLRASGVVVGRFFTFIGCTLRDTARTIGAILAAVVISLLTVGCVVIGRWSAAAHFGRAVKAEFAMAGLSFFRLVFANPLRLFGLEGVTEGLERRLPQVVSDVPIAEPSAFGGSGGGLGGGLGGDLGRRAKFKGYTIVGTLPVGGSGAKLYIANPDAITRAGFERAGVNGVDQVVIKAFSLDDGSSLPQIVRESRALDAAKKLGLILDHALTADRFHYVMRYVPGESLTQVTKRLHGTSEVDGLGPREVRSCLSYASDLLATLAAYHRGGLWHKDVKPDNIIVDTRSAGKGGTGKAYLVDFGLLSSLRSAMTLTTHGTEYFRDPELVRMAVKGVKVHEVDGTRFDVYGAGAVLFAMIEDGFPPHGGLSQVTRKCPDAVRWIIRRAMADYDKRYAGADEMLADVRTVLAAADPFTVRPADLPSVGALYSSGESLSGESASDENIKKDSAGSAHSAQRARIAAGLGGMAGLNGAGAGVDTRVATGAQGAPKVTVTNWWTGKTRVDWQAAQGPSAAVQSHKPKVDEARKVDGSRQEISSVQSAIDAAQIAPGVRVGVGMGVGFNGASERAGGSSLRRSAKEQREAAGVRVQTARARADERIRRNTPTRATHDTGMNVGVAMALLLVSGLAVGIYSISTSGDGSALQSADNGLIVQARSMRVPTLLPGGMAEFRGVLKERDSAALIGDEKLALKGRAFDEQADAAKTMDVGFDSLAMKPIVLVVVDALPPLPVNVKDLAGAIESKLREAGMNVVGRGSGSGREEIEWLAAVRMSVGQIPVDSSSVEIDRAAWNVQEFLAKYTALNAVVWVSVAAEGQDGESAPSVHVFVSPLANKEEAEKIAKELAGLWE